MLGGVWLIYLGFGLLSVAMAPLVDPISRDLGLSYTTMGAILGAWPLVYIVAAAPCGAFVDRVGLKWSLFLAVLVIAASGGLRAVAFDAATLFVAVGLFGIGGPLISIGAPKAIAQWFQGAERGLAMGVYITGPALGNMLALALTNSVLMPLTGGNWRQVLLIYSGFILITGLAWFLLGSHPINRVVERAGRHRETVAGQMAVFARLLRLPSIQVILAISIGAFFFHHALSNWLPEILRTGGMTPDVAGIWSAVPTAIGIVGALLIPRLATPPRRFAILFGLSLCAGAGALMLLVAGTPALVVAMILQGIGRGSLIAVLILVLMETRGVDARHIGAAVGLFFSAAEIGGVLGPLAIGAASDLTGGFDAGLWLLGAVSAAVIGLLTLHRGIERRDATMTSATIQGDARREQDSQAGASTKSYRPRHPPPPRSRLIARPSR